VKYEDLREDCAGQLQRIVFELTGNKLNNDKAQAITEKFSFQKQSGRQPGQENTDSFMRKGIVGDWKKPFFQRSQTGFQQFCRQGTG
jgi:hypothetical protein